MVPHLCALTPWSIHTSHTACFCSSCVDEDWNGCESKESVDEWYTRILSPLASYQPHESLQLTEMESSIEFDHLSDLLQPVQQTVKEKVFETKQVLLILM